LQFLHRFGWDFLLLRLNASFYFDGGPLLPAVVVSPLFLSQLELLVGHKPFTKFLMVMLLSLVDNFPHPAILFHTVGVLLESSRQLHPLLPELIGQLELFILKLLLLGAVFKLPFR
jgi:hypothetical protein